ncbi:MAG: DUF4190 domain-containing protein [Kineosporiaceae bacterium]
MTATETPYPSPPPPPPPLPAPQGGTAPLAVVGLVLAFLLPLIGAILSFVALGQTGSGKRGGRGLAIAGAVIGTLLTLGGVIALVVSFLVAGAAVQAVDEASTELSEITEELDAAYQDKAAVDAGEIPDFSGDFATGSFAAGDLGGSLEVTITNSGDMAYAYTATVAAVSPDGATQYDTAVVFVDELAPGQSSVQEAVFFTEVPADATFELVDYSRVGF